MSEKAKKIASEIDQVSSLESNLVQDQEGTFKDDELQQLSTEIKSIAANNKKSFDKIIEDQKQKVKDDEERKNTGDN